MQYEIVKIVLIHLLFYGVGVRNPATYCEEQRLLSLLQTLVESVHVGKLHKDASASVFRFQFNENCACV